MSRDRDGNPAAGPAQVGAVLPRSAWRLLAALWALFWVLMIVVAVQDGWRNPDRAWWEPVLWEGSSALFFSVLALGLLRAGRGIVSPLATPWRWFWVHMRWLPVVSTVFVIVTYAVRHAAYALAGRRYLHESWPDVWVYETIKLGLFLGLWLGVLFGLYSFVAWRGEQLRLAAAERALAEARLLQLRAQLQPHFLFNTLNTISAFMHADVARADRLLQRLAELLRGSLALGERALVPLAEELALARAYVAIMEERFAPRVRVEWRIDAGLETWPVPALVLQPLLENAFRHAVEPCVGTVDIRVVARRAGADLELCVGDRPEPQAVRPAAAAGTGIGLRNTRDRLDALYGARAALAAGPRDGGWETVLRIPETAA